MSAPADNSATHINHGAAVMRTDLLNGERKARNGKSGRGGR
jgi:hypothetical protein